MRRGHYERAAAISDARLFMALIWAGVDISRIAGKQHEMGSDLTLRIPDWHRGVGCHTIAIDLARIYQSY